MSTPSPSQWYVKSDDGAAGPFSAQELVQMACTGNLVGSDELSASTKGPWLKAETLDALEMEWQVQPENAAPLPRCHVMALRNWVEDETVQPYWDILHIPSGESYDVVDALCSALLAQNHVLEDQLSRAHGEAGEAESAPGGGSQLEADHAKREAAKWKRLYEDEIRRNETREQELLQEVESLRAWQRKAAERIKALERRQASLKESREAGTSHEAFTGGDHELAAAYGELKLQMIHLQESLQLKSGQLEDSREQIRELRLKLKTERREREEESERNSGQLEETLDQLTRMEQAHEHLTRSYRDLNDKLIRLRNQKEEAPKPAAPSSPAKPAAAAQPVPSPARPAPQGKGPKIKMT